MDQSRSKAAVLKFLDAMGRYDVATLRGMLADEAKWWMPESAKASGLGRPVTGANACAELGGGKTLGSFRPGSTDWQIQHMTAEGDFVAILMRRRAQGARGQPYDVQYHWLFRFQGERVAEIWEVLDTAEAGRQLAAE
jgi:ketosteroid isomerase-like protein